MKRRQQQQDHLESIVVGMSRNLTSGLIGAPTSQSRAPHTYSHARHPACQAPCMSSSAMMVLETTPISLTFPLAGGLLSVAACAIAPLPLMVLERQSY